MLGLPRARPVRPPRPRPVFGAGGGSSSKVGEAMARLGEERTGAEEPPGPRRRFWSFRAPPGVARADLGPASLEGRPLLTVFGGGGGLGGGGLVGWAWGRGCGGRGGGFFLGCGWPGRGFLDGCGGCGSFSGDFSSRWRSGFGWRGYGLGVVLCLDNGYVEVFFDLGFSDIIESVEIGVHCSFAHYLHQRA